jgi:hypothetical protein
LPAISRTPNGARLIPRWLRAQADLGCQPRFQQRPAGGLIAQPQHREPRHPQRVNPLGVQLLHQLLRHQAGAIDQPPDLR